MRENYVISNEPSNKIIFMMKDVSFKYLNSDIEIFEGINLNITKGSHTIITGTNGTGKSTLLGLLAGVYYSNTGKVLARTGNRFGFKRNKS